MSPHRSSPRKGFTLIELLVVIAIIAILAVVVVLTLNPAELLRQSRDANRVSDLATLNSAINLYITDQGGSNGFSLGSSSVTYLSVPDPAATTTAGTNCAGLGTNFTSGTYFDCSASSTYRNASGQGWIPINFSSISSGIPFGSLPVDPVNATSSDLYYSYQTNGTTFRLVASPESQKDTAAAGANPSMFTSGSNASLYGNWILVPGNSTFGTGNFYVMKYDASCETLSTGIALTTPTDGNAYKNNNGAAANCIPANGLSAASLPNAIPIVDISQASSSAACAAIGAHLMTNNEWQTIAWNAENVGSNWSLGAVGSGYIYSGHNNNDPATALTASSDDTQGYYGETVTSTSQIRTLTLSDGSVVWDMAGNIYQWTSDQIAQAQKPTGNTGAWVEWTTVTYGGSTLSQATAGPMNSSWTHTNGIGEYYEGTVDPAGFIRSGNWNNGGSAGVEALILLSVPGATNSYLGFRCVR
jgi:prepilin-type N-terminal cleavage/methylation domain-containing protein